jgi:PAS domain S-box-containing protein
VERTLPDQAPTLDLSKNSANKLGVAYILAITTIALLCIGSFLSLKTLIQEQKKNTVLVNIAGRQRRISQTIALDCLKLASPALRSDNETIRSHLTEQLQLFNSSHSALLHRTGDLENTRPMSAEEHKIYYDDPLRLDHDVQEFSAHVTNIINNTSNDLTASNPDVTYVLKAAETYLLTKLDEAVSQCDTDSQHSVAEIETLESRLFAATLLLLLLEALFIFRPLVNRVQKQVQNLIDFQRELAAIFDNVGDALISMDEDYTIHKANPQVTAIWGYSPTELVGKNFKDIVDTALMLDRRTTTEAIHRNGSKVPLELVIRRTTLSDRVLLTVAANDITERKRIETEMSLAHELQIPLISLASSLKLVQAGKVGPVDAQTKTVVDTTMRDTDHLVELLGDYLDLIKMRAGMIKPNSSYASMHDLLAASTARLAEEAKARDITMKEYCTIDFRLKGDKERLIQVIANLLLNAIKCSQPGATVVISLQKGTTENWCRCTFTAQGPSIPENELADLFGMFRRSKVVDGKEQGIGAGLALSKAIVEQHGGKIGVESLVGQGPKFWFELPSIEAATLPDPKT